VDLDVAGSSPVTRPNQYNVEERRLALPSQRRAATGIRSPAPSGSRPKAPVMRLER
jgi:hypothetical protein